MPDTSRIKRNITKMIESGAPSHEIDAYVASEGVTPEILRGEKVPYTSVQENLTAPTRQAVDKVKGRFGKMLKGQDKGPSLGDLAAVPLSVLGAPMNAVTRPIAQAVTNSGLSLYDQRLSHLITQNPFTYAPKQVKGKEAEDMLNTDIGTALSSGMPARGAVGRSGPQIPQGLKVAKAKTPTEKALRRLIADQNLGTAKAKASQFEEAGITDYRPIDILDDNARARAMAYAARKTPARSQINKLADQERVDFGGRVSKHIERNISDTPQDAEDVIKALYEEQGQTARQKYGPQYDNSRVRLEPDQLGVINLPEAQKALRASEYVNRNDITPNPTVSQGLQDLRGAATNAGDFSPSKPARIPASVLDRIQIALRERASDLYENGSRTLGSKVNTQRKLINSWLDDVEGLKEARTTFANQQRVIEAAEAAPNALRAGNGNEIFQATQGLDLDQLAPARNVLSREMQRRLGERVSSAPSNAEAFTATEPMQRIAAYTGPEAAQRFSNATGLELERLRNLNAVAPGKGLKSLAVAEDDLKTAQDLSDVSRAGIATVFGNKFHAGFIALKLWAKHMGVSNKDAELLAQIAVDPTKSGDVIKALSGKYGVAKATKLTAAAKAYAAESAASNMNEENNDSPQ